MADVFGKRFARDAFRARVGEMGQAAGIERVVLDDGHARGVRAAILRTGSGLDAEILIDRAMDLGRVHYKGAPLAHRGAAGDVHPAFYNPDGLGWLRTFGVGLVTTCGMQNAGAPNVDEGAPYGLHGGLSATPACEIAEKAEWIGDEYVFSITGKMREITARGLFGPNLCLTRTISSALGANWIKIEDEVSNDGFTPSALLILYHINVGFPIVDEGARLLSAASSVVARDAVAAPGLATHDRFEAPIPTYKEQVFFHEMLSDAKGIVRVAISAPKRGKAERLAFVVEYPKAQMPMFSEWKQVGAGNYVVGLEPGNCSVLGRANERKQGRLRMLKPCERRRFELTLRVLEGAAEIRALEARLARLKRGNDSAGRKSASRRKAR